MRPTTSILLAAAGVLLLAACDTTPREQPTTVESQPHAADYYSQVLQRQLTEPDPVISQQQLVCEVGRMTKALGGKETALRVRGVTDSVVQTAGELANARRVAAKASTYEFEIAGPICDSLNVIAARIAPMTPTPAGEAVAPKKTP